MKKTTKLLPLSLIVLMGMCGCGGGGDTPTPLTRENHYVADIGEMENGAYTSYGENKEFPSLYEAISYCYDNGENGSFVYAKGDEAKQMLYQKRASCGSVVADKGEDTWFYYNKDAELEGMSLWLSGYQDFYIGEPYINVFQTAEGLAPCFQPYELIPGNTETGSSTMTSWNNHPYLDGNICYDLVPYSGIMESHYTVNLSKARIRESQNKDQIAKPCVALSTNDSYNMSRQGIYMDTATGNWYYFSGESQSEDKEFEYDTQDVIMTSTYDAKNHEWKPNNDITISLYTERNPEDEDAFINRCTIDILENGTVKNTKEFVYDMAKLTITGTHRAEIFLDMCPANPDEVDEGNMLPDFMSGAYFKNIEVSKATGILSDKLTFEDYGYEFLKTPGEYNLLACSEKNEAKLHVAKEAAAHITSDVTGTVDKYDIDYTEVAPKETHRTAPIVECENLISQIKDTDNELSESVQKANEAWLKLSQQQQAVVNYIDNLYKKLDDALARQ